MATPLTLPSPLFINNSTCQFAYSLQTENHAQVTPTDPLIEFDPTSPALLVKPQYGNTQVGYNTYFITGSIIAGKNSASYEVIIQIYCDIGELIPSHFDTTGPEPNMMAN